MAALLIAPFLEGAIALAVSFALSGILGAIAGYLLLEALRRGRRTLRAGQRATTRRNASGRAGILRAWVGR